MLEMAGEGDHRPELEAEIARARARRRACDARARQRGAEARAAPARVGEPDRVVGRGLVPDRDGGGGVRHPERGARRRRPARVDRGRRDRPARARRPRSWSRRRGRSSATPSCASASAERARERAREFTWDRTAAAHARRARGGARRQRQPSRAVAAQRLARIGHRPRRRAGRARHGRQRRRAGRSRSSSRACSATTGYGSLAALLSAFLILRCPARRCRSTVAREVSTRVAAGDAGAGAPACAAGSRGSLLQPSRSPWSRPAARAARRRRSASTRTGRPRPCCPAGCCGWSLSVERGALQGFQRYRRVGLSHHRRGVRAARASRSLLVAVGLGVTGAFLGTACRSSAWRSCSSAAAPAARPRQRATGRVALARPAAGAWAPGAGARAAVALQEIT